MQVGHTERHFRYEMLKGTKSHLNKYIGHPEKSVLAFVTVSENVTAQKLVSWCFELSQPLKIISGLKTNFIPSVSCSAHKSFNHIFSSLQGQLSILGIPLCGDTIAYIRTPLACVVLLHHLLRPEDSNPSPTSSRSVRHQARSR